jgi:glucose/arabinose dehydrogenase
VADGFAAPLFVTNAADGSGRIFVLEQGGRIQIVARGRRRAQPFLDISDRVRSGGEQGLLGLAFHPRFENNRRFFVNYTDRSGNTVVSEFRRAAKRPNRAAPGSERVLLRIEQPFSNHNGGGLAFGPDRMLYISTGDGGGAGDPTVAGQRLDTLLGKILRIDVHRGRAGSEPYAIPGDNPFVGRAEARDEIWMYGLRNPWRMSFDRSDGTLWIADVGQNAVEEVNRIAPGESGLNLGWNIKEGDQCFGGQAECNVPGLTDPLTVYGHNLGCSVTGGYVYRGRRSPALTGTYLFGDFCSGRVFMVEAEGPEKQEPVQLSRTGHSISSFGLNEQGEVFLTDLSGGGLYRIEGRLP